MRKAYCHEKLMIFTVFTVLPEKLISLSFPVPREILKFQQTPSIVIYSISTNVFLYMTRKIAKGLGSSVIANKFFPLLVVLTHQPTGKTLYQCFYRKLLRPF